MAYIALTYSTLLSSQGTDAHWYAGFLLFSGQTAKPSPYMPPRSNRATSHELELIIDAVRPKTSDSQQERNYNPHAHEGQIGPLAIPA